MNINRLLTLAMFAFLATLFTGCTTRSLADKLAEFEKLGISEAQITGKFSNTTYTVVKKNGQRTATLDHSNAWMTKIKLVRETPAPEPAAPTEVVGPLPPPGLIVPPATPLSPGAGTALRRD